MLELHPENIFLRIRFYVPVGDENDPRMDIAAKLLMINEILSNPNEMGFVLYKWYKEKQLPLSVTDLLKNKPKDKFNTALKIQKNGACIIR